MAYKTITAVREGVVGTITLNRPDVLNAMNEEMRRELTLAVQEMEDDEEVAVIIFTGAGNAAFSSGSDLGESSQDGARAEAMSDDDFAWQVASCSKPTIGAINGMAYGGGAALAASFDIRVGSEKTSFRFVSSHGRVGATWSLPQLVGWPMAKEFLLTAREVDPKEAYRLGLLNHLVASDQVMLKAIELARYIEANDPNTVKRVKELLNKGLAKQLEEMRSNERTA